MKLLNEKPKKLAAYLRVSSEKQRDAGTIEIQRAAIADYCFKRDLEVLEYFEDDGISGTKSFLDRPQGAELWKQISAGEFDGIIIYKVDRIARSLKSFVDFADLILSKNCALILVDNDFNLGTQIGKMLIGILAVFAEWEHATILDRAASGKRRKLKAGKILGRPPYGYDNVNNSLVVDPVRAPFVKKVFEDYVLNKSYREIMAELNAAEAPVPPGRLRKTWAHHHVESMLKNPCYFGEYHALRTDRIEKGKRIGRRDTEDIIKIKVPAIVSKDLFDRVQRKIKDNRWMGPASKKRFYLLRGLIKCTKCKFGYIGRGYKGGTYQRKDGRVEVYKEQRFYECASKYKSKLLHVDYCGNSNLNAFEIEKLVWGQIEEFLTKPNLVIDKILEKQRLESKKKNTEHKDSAALKSRLGKAELKMKRIKKAVIDGTFTREEIADERDEVRREIVVLTDQIGALERKIKDTDESRNAWLNTARELLDKLAAKFRAGLSDEEKRAIVELLVAEIKVFTEYPQGAPAAGALRTSKPHRPVVEVSYIFDENFSSALSYSSSET